MMRLSSHPTRALRSPLMVDWACKKSSIDQTNQAVSDRALILPALFLDLTGALFGVVEKAIEATIVIVGELHQTSGFVC